MLVCDYIVESIDGDYAHLRRTDLPEEELKDQLTALIDEYEEEETHTGKADELIEALDALEDASETIEDVLEN